jgi:hypothetical protein
MQIEWSTTVSQHGTCVSMEHATQALEYIQCYIYCNDGVTRYFDVHCRSECVTRWCTHRERRMLRSVENVLYAKSIIRHPERSSDSCYSELI